jgi:hypothetical protein
MFAVYLAVDFIQLYIDIMQRPLNTHSFTLSSHLKRTLTTSRIWLLASLTLLLITALASPAAAGSGFYKDFVILNPGSGPSTYYYTNNGGDSGFASFQSKNLGSFDRGNGKLLLGAEANTYNDNGDDVYPPQMFYRVYAVGSAPGSFTPLNLSFKSSGDDNNSINKKWINTSTLPNLINSTPGAGRYVLEVFFQSYITYNNSGGSGSSNIYDNNGGFTNVDGYKNYTATFEVTGSVPTTWVGNTNGNDNWFIADNWSPKVVPDFQTDVTIPFTSGTKYPVIRDRSKIAQVRTLTITGNNGSLSAGVTLEDGELQVFGDFYNTTGGFYQSGGVFTLAGSTTQTFSGGRFADVRIQGGSIKQLSSTMVILSSLTFNTASGGGTISTGTTNSTDFGVNLLVRATITGEDENNYVLGVLNSTRVVNRGIASDFGGIGIDLTANAADPGTVVATRYTGVTYAGVGRGTKNASVARSFTFTAENPQNSNFTLNFHYLDRELNGNSSSNLSLFSSPPNSGVFTMVGKTTTNPAAKTAFLANITNSLASTFTLAQDAPLPVTLVSFTATPTPQGAALLRWVTAKELNNKGFGIERTLGTTDTWQQVGYVATTNTPNGKSYEYTDKSLTTAPASTQAYYRLRQEDLDGKVTYSPVAAVARQAALASTGIVLSPVPLDGPNLSVSFAEAGQAGQEVAIINTQGQRMLHFTTQNSAEGTLSLPVANLAAGVYIVRIQTPGQAVRHARFVKL